MALPQLIGIHGHAGVGKDLIARYIYEKYNDCYIEPFAGPLKQCAATAFGIPLSDFYDSDAKEVINPYWEVSPRMIAQFLGTELFRESMEKFLGEQYKNAFWVVRMNGKLSGDQRGDEEGDYISSDTVIIPDVRFQNEYDWIMANNGIVIHLTREGKTGNIGILNHASEAGIQSFHAPMRTYLINNNSTKEKLYEEVDKVINAMHLVLYYPADVKDISINDL